MRHIIAGTSVLTIIMMGGCATIDKANRADMLEQEVLTLQGDLRDQKKSNQEEIDRLLKERQRLLEEKDREIQALMAQKDQQVQEVKEKKEEELSELEKAKRDLENSLSQELKDYKAKLEMTERGLVLTFLAEIFFDSGKDVIREDAKPTLQKVTEILNRDVIDSKIAIEGHTDNEPIKHSNWKSNWELSAARALAVLHNFIDEGRVDPQRVSAVAYGEFFPLVANDTPQNRQQNRRVEIVILPTKFEKVRNKI